jgi:hypothetical protein
MRVPACLYRDIWDYIAEVVPLNASRPALTRPRSARVR